MAQPLAVVDYVGDFFCFYAHLLPKVFFPGRIFQLIVVTLLIRNLL